MMKKLNILSAKIFVLTLLLVAAMLPQKASAQDFVINAKLDSTNILIGHQVKLSLEVTQMTHEKILFPVIEEKLADMVEVVEKSVIDTLKSKGKNRVLRQEIIITSFDSGGYAIPPFRFLVHKDGRVDTHESNSLFLNVHTIKVDTANAIADIKMPIDTPFTFKEFWHRFSLYFYGGILLIILIVVAIIMYKRHKENKPVIKIPRKVIPAEVTAQKQLNELKEKKLWQQGKVKPYYSELTGILRVYIEKRFSVPAMEQTSDEILTAMSGAGRTDDHTLELLRQIFSLSDLAKFAKQQPLPNENDLSMSNANLFVSKTKPEVVAAEQKQETENVES